MFFIVLFSICIGIMCACVFGNTSSSDESYREEDYNKVTGEDSYFN